MTAAARVSVLKDRIVNLSTVDKLKLAAGMIESGVDPELALEVTMIAAGELTVIIQHWPKGRS